MRELAIVCTMVVSTAARAGVRIEMESSGPGGTPGAQQTELQGDKLRVDYTADTTGTTGIHRNGIMIFDGAQMISCDAKTKVCTAIDAAQIKAQQERMRQMQANLPPETRAQVEKAMKQAEPGSIAFKKVSGGDTVAGFSCSNYTQSRNGVERGTVCIAAWKGGPVKKEELGALSKFVSALGTTEASKKAMMINPDEWPGFPLSMSSPDGKTMRLKSVTHTTLPDSEFEPPAGYTRQALPLGAGPR
jgi:hypothetical protein